MKPSERFYNLAMPVWQTYFDHPFVKGIGDGTLEKDKFRYYMIQGPQVPHAIREGLCAWPSQGYR